MEFVHRCSFCDWSRSAATAVMLKPACPDCGCALDATERARVESPLTVAAPQAALGQLAGVRVAIVAFAAVVLFAAVRYGIAKGGGPGALIALGVAGFLLLPFLPERMRPGNARG